VSRGSAAWLWVASGGGRVYGPDSPGRRSAKRGAGRVPCPHDAAAASVGQGGQVSGWPGDVLAVELSVLEAVMQLPEKRVLQASQRSSGIARRVAREWIERWRCSRPWRLDGVRRRA
jgi:hypothetical protein